MRKSEVTNTSKSSWYRNVPRTAWAALLLASLGWLFDTMDQNLFNLVRQPSVIELLTKNGVPAAQVQSMAANTGAQLTAIFLVGWAVGGLVFGILGDRLGRVRTIAITVGIYACFTGFNALVTNIGQYEVCRFLTALGVGGEFAAGAALVAETWPAEGRAMALGLLQALSAVGNMIAALINLSLAAVSWRYVYLVGAAPAIMVVWLTRRTSEPVRWTEEHAEAQASGKLSELGDMRALFANAPLRRNAIAGILMGLAGVGGLWGAAYFLPDLVGSALKPLVASLTAKEAAAQLARWRSQAFLVQQIGGFIGMFAYAPISQRIGRRPTLVIAFWVGFLAVEGTYRYLTSNMLSVGIWAFLLGVCALMPFGAFAVYFPELFPTKLRTTGIGLCYNCARILAAGATLTLGQLASHFASATDPSAGLRTAAEIVALVYVAGIVGVWLAPETRGKALPQ